MASDHALHQLQHRRDQLGCAATAGAGGSAAITLSAAPGHGGWRGSPSAPRSATCAARHMRVPAALQFGPGASLFVGDEANGMLLHEAAKAGLLGALPFIVKRGPIGRPLGCRPMACTQASRGCDLGRSQAARSGSIGRSIESLRVPVAAGTTWERSQGSERPLRGGELSARGVGSGSGQDRRHAGVTAADQPSKRRRREAARRERVHSTHQRHTRP